MRPVARLAAAALAATLALAVAAPLQSARCSVASGKACPMMKGATGSLCHRGGATMAPAMSCCKTRGTPAPAPAGERPAPAAPLAVLPGSATGIVPESLASPDIAGFDRASRAAEARHALGLFTLLAVFRN